jgi:hypothetical protein
LNATLSSRFEALHASQLSLSELRALTQNILHETTLGVHDELESLLAQKEHLEYLITRKNEELQHVKYRFFDEIETHYAADEPFLEKLHLIKVQSVELLDILEEMIESAILTTLEKSSDIEETLQEIIKDITFEILNANVLNAVRIRRILSAILQSAIDVAEATPNQAEAILRGTLLGIRLALHKSIEKFRQYLLYVPEEVKALRRNEYLQIEEELEHIDTLYVQIVEGLRKNNSAEIINTLTRLGTEVRFDTDELSNLSHETAVLLQNKLVKLREEMKSKGEKLLNSPKAQEAKAMGVRAWSVAKSAMEGALKSAREAIDKK